MGKKISVIKPTGQDTHELSQLADEYQAKWEVAASIPVIERWAALCPQDPRPFYALGTAYYMLARALWVGKPGRIPPSMLAALRPDLALREVRKAGLTVHAAILMAVCAFETCLRLQPDRPSCAAVKRHLASLCQMQQIAESK